MSPHRFLRSAVLAALVALVSGVDAGLGYVNASLTNFLWPETNEPTNYLVNVSLGTPPQPVSMWLDTGSSNLWVRTTNTCPNTTICPFGSFDTQQSSTFKGPDAPVPLAYGDVTLRGHYAHDTVSLDGKSVSDMSIIVMDMEDPITYVAGNLGIAGPNLEASVFFDHTNQSNATSYAVPNIWGMLANAKLIDRAAWSLFLGPVDTGEGQVIFGGIDTAKYQGDLVELPIQVDPATGRVDFGAVSLTSVSISDKSLSRRNSDVSVKLTPDNFNYPADLDSGTTGATLQPEIFDGLVAALGAINVPDAGYILVPCTYDSVSDVTIDWEFGGNDGITIKVPLADMVSRRFGTQKVGETEMCSLEFVSSQGETLVKDGHNVLGDLVLRSMYLVLDWSTKHMAIAQAKYTTDSNIVALPAQGDIQQVSRTNTLRVPTKQPSMAPTAHYSIPTETTAVPTPLLSALQSPSGSASSSAAAAAFVASGNVHIWQAVLVMVAILLGAVTLDG